MKHDIDVEERVDLAGDPAGSQLVWREKNAESYESKVESCIK